MQNVFVMKVVETENDSFIKDVAVNAACTYIRPLNDKYLSPVKFILKP